MLATVAGSQLTADLKPQLALLVDDMRTRLDEDADRTEQWRAAHERAKHDLRTAASWTDYVEDQLTQAAVGWLLTSVFVRFCEDNLLLGPTAVWITSPDPSLRQRALDAEQHFYRTESGDEQGARSYREWLEESFAALRNNPGTASLVDDHAAIGIIEPSSYAVEQLLAYWRRTDDNGDLLWRFDDPDVSTRFLGDLYQDLSEYAKKKFALLQTPEFVEEFILDRTMEPALKDRPLEGFKLIDPTCGSGHFLLGAFARLVQRWAAEAPGMERRARVDKALASVHGVDINAFAVAIAKFRLIVAAMRACGDSDLVNVPRWTLKLATGDSLLFGPERGGQHAFGSAGGFIDKDSVASGFAYSTEDHATLADLLTLGQYDVVVGNPPYIQVSDKALNLRYRERYECCKGSYALTVPFMERFFALAKTGDRSGYIGQITSNSFMKRRFGVPLIERFLAHIDLQCIIDSEGAWIPGHNMDGTPTVILVGRNRSPSASIVRAILSMGIRELPSDAAAKGHGPYWASIVEHIDEPGYEDRWISVVDLDRQSLASHPWSLSGGGAVETLARLHANGDDVLIDKANEIGFGAVTREDAAYILGEEVLVRSGIPTEQRRPIVLGENVRDWQLTELVECLWPYDEGSLNATSNSTVSQFLWPLRKTLSERVAYGSTQIERGLRWFEYSMFFKERFRDTNSITFAEVATHNHFSIDRSGMVFNRTAPIIKLPRNAEDRDFFGLISVLNSSAACFWIKQKFKAKGGAADQSWARTYQINGTTLGTFPLPNCLPARAAEVLDNLATTATSVEPAATLATHGPSRSSLNEAKRASITIRAEMIRDQEDLDWEVYQLYGLIDENLNLPEEESGPGIALGERAFEIALARRMKDGDVETEWFNRHGSTPITEIPAHWPQDYRDLVQRRLDAIDSNLYIKLLERPEYKRRWAGESWDTKLQQALRDWLLDKIENPLLWANQQGMPQPRSIGELAGDLGRDPEFIEALDLWAGHKDAPVTETLVKLLADQTVPYLAALRYKDSGLRKRAEWERVWDLQRDEDAGLIKATDIPVPPKYTSADFRKTSYWSHRGKLDVPKERFILYPDAGRVTDPTPLLGWAGWNHAQQGLALATIYALRESEGVDREQLVPVVAGIAELLPWVKQWHSGVDPNVGVDLYEYLYGQLQEKAQQVGVPISQLGQWRPVESVRGRGRRKKSPE